MAAVAEIPDVLGGYTGLIYSFFYSFQLQTIHFTGRMALASGVVFISPRCNDLVLPNLVRAFCWIHPRGDVFTTYHPLRAEPPDWLTQLPSKLPRPSVISTGSLPTRFGAKRTKPTLFVLRKADITPTLLKSIHKYIVSTSYYLIITDTETAAHKDWGLAIGLHHYIKNIMAVTPTPTQPLCMYRARIGNMDHFESVLDPRHRAMVRWVRWARFLRCRQECDPYMVPDLTQIVASYL